MKTCPFCAEEIQDAAIKCRHCGSMLTSSSSETGTQRAAPGIQIPAATTIFRGGPSWIAQFWSVLGAAMLGLGGLVLGPVLHVSFDVPWLSALVGAAVLVTVAAAWLLVLWVARATLRFHVTTRAIDVESGFLSKNIETLQLWKVRDLEFHQTLTDRLLGAARIRVFTHDVTTPQILLWGLPGSRGVFDQLKDAIEIARQARNVIGLVE